MKKTKILVIEDNDDIRESTAEILELADYEVLQANNGKAGVDLAVKHLPDMILCDIMMPELDGYGVLYLLNKNPATALTPFIFLTAKAERIDVRKGMEMGADDYLTKPFDDMELLNAIESRLNKIAKHQKNMFQPASQSGQSNSMNGIDELKKVISERKPRNIKKSQVIYYEGDAVAGVYLVLSGKVKTVKLSEDGRELLTGMYGKDEYFGVNALILNQPYHETAEALEDTSICLLPKDIIENLLAQYPDVAGQFIGILSHNLKEKEEQLLQMAYHSVRKRMAEVLLRLFKQEKDKDATLKISRDNLASMAGIATETVSRILSDFKDEGLIERNGSQVVLLDMKRMESMKN